MSATVLVFVATVAAAALAAPTGLNQIEHVVIFMQENRAFDHYFGTLPYVRGFGDHAAPPLPNGRPVWYQPTSLTNRSAYMLPFHVDLARSSGACMDAPRMGSFVSVGGGCDVC